MIADKFTKVVTMFEDIKYQISSIKKYLRNTYTNTSNTEKLPEEIETLIPALSLNHLTAFNEHLKQKSIFDLYVSNS